MRHQPQRPGKKRAVSHFSGNDHLTDRQKEPRAHRAECLMSVFTVSLPCLTLLAIQQGVTEYQPAICKATAERCSQLQALKGGHVSARMTLSIYCDEQILTCSTIRHMSLEEKHSLYPFLYISQACYRLIHLLDTCVINVT